MSDEKKLPVTPKDLVEVSSPTELGKAFAKLRENSGYSVRMMASQARKKYGDENLSVGIIHAMTQGKQIVQSTGKLFDDCRIERFLELCDYPREAHSVWLAAALRVCAPGPAKPVPGSNPDAAGADESSRSLLRRTALINVAAATVLLLLLLLLTAVVYVVRNEGSADTPPGIGGEPLPPVTTTTTTASPLGAPLDQTSGCPHTQQPAKAPAYISIIAWCHAPMLNSDGTMSTERQQLKLRPCITNETGGVLDLSITKTETKSAALRLLVTATDLPGSWQPPPATAAAGDHPVRVNWQNNTYWAIPPNVPGDAAQVPSLANPGQMTWDGFATIWDDIQLTPDERVFYKPIVYEEGSDWPKQEADLVFNLPLAESSQLEVFGLAVVDSFNPSIVIAVSPPHNEWPEKMWAALF